MFEPAQWEVVSRFLPREANYQDACLYCKKGTREQEAPVRDETGVFSSESNTCQGCRVLFHLLPVCLFGKTSLGRFGQRKRGRRTPAFDLTPFPQGTRQMLVATKQLVGSPQIARPPDRRTDAAAVAR